MASRPQSCRHVPHACLTRETAYTHAVALNYGFSQFAVRLQQPENLYSMQS